MGVEILVLSGTRQGAQLELDADEFRAGGDESCEVFFDPEADIGAKGRVALFRRTDEGWCIQNAGTGELLLNQESVSRRTRIRSGDIVRLSDRGPDFSFSILAGRLTPWADSPVEKTPSADKKEISPTAAETEKVSESDATCESKLVPIAPPSHSRKKPLLIGTGAGVGILALIVFLILGLSPKDDVKPVGVIVSNGKPDAVQDTNGSADKNGAQSVDGDSNGHKDKTDLPAAVDPPVDDPPNQKIVTTTAGTENTTEQKPPKPDPPPAAIAPTNKWEEIAQRYDKAVWLLEVGDADGKFVYPFATACAVGDRTLLTSAAVAEELAKFRAKGWKIWAKNNAVNKTVPLGRIRVHGLFAAFGKNPEKKIYVDVALLDTEQPLPAVAPLASAAELAKLDTGDEVACVGIAHEGDAMKPDDESRRNSLLPQLMHGKLFVKTKVDPKSASSPRLLHLKASLPGNLYGSPIIDQHGKVIAVYAEAASGEGKQLRLHYAPVVDSVLIGLTRNGKSSQYWVPPLISPTDPKAGKQLEKDKSTKKGEPSGQNKLPRKEKDAEE